VRLHFTASSAPEAQGAHEALVERFGNTAAEDCDVIVALGGDGLMLQCLHQQMTLEKPIYGMNRGSIGFLMNEYRIEDLPARIEASERAVIHPLIMTAVTADGSITEARAINEVSILRASYQAAKLTIFVDGRERLHELVADGILLSTPAGSTAYNLSANGPILPLDAPLMALTPISPFRPRRWRGALLPDRASVRILSNGEQKRPINAVADHIEVADVLEVGIRMDHRMDLVMLHDPGHGLEERILREQFDA
jgi:NAD+ kinase